MSLFRFKITEGPEKGSVMHVESDLDMARPEDYAEELGLTARFIFTAPKFSHLDTRNDLAILCSPELIKMAEMLSSGEPILTCLEYAQEQGIDLDDAAAAARAFEGAVIAPIYCYEHGAIAFRTTPFHCPWDSGCVGIAVMEAATVESHFAGDVEAAERALANDVATFSLWANGEAFMVGVSASDSDDDMPEMVGGFLGTDWDSNGAFETLFGRSNVQLEQIQ